jgi:Zn finger protein HypA/HybF involved in hydrogenase expression
MIIIMSAKIGTENRDLVICNNCQWAVSLLKGSQPFDWCPVCNSRTLEVIPVEDYESYKLDIRGKRGLSIEFTEDSLRPDL